MHAEPLPNLPIVLSPKPNKVPDTVAQLYYWKDESQVLPSWIINTTDGARIHRLLGLLKYSNASASCGRGNIERHDLDGKKVLNCFVWIRRFGGGRWLERGETWGYRSTFRRQRNSPWQGLTARFQESYGNDFEIISYTVQLHNSLVLIWIPVKTLHSDLVLVVLSELGVMQAVFNGGNRMEKRHQTGAGPEISADNSKLEWWEMWTPRGSPLWRYWDRCWVSSIFIKGLESIFNIRGLIALKQVTHGKWNLCYITMWG